MVLVLLQCWADIWIFFGYSSQIALRISKMAFDEYQQYSIWYLECRISSIMIFDLLIFENYGGYNKDVDI